MTTIDERRMGEAWKAVDDVLRLLERVQEVATSVHRGVEVASLRQCLDARRVAPYYVVLSDQPASGEDVAPPVGLAIGNLPIHRLRDGVYLLPFDHAPACSWLGLLRLSTDVLVAKAGDPRWAPLIAKSPSIAAPVRAHSLDSVLALAPASDRALAAFGAVRLAFHAVRELGRSLGMELRAIEGTLVLSERSPMNKDVAPSDELDYLQRLDDLLAERVDSERDRERDREDSFRRFSLAARGLVASIGTDSFEQSIRSSAIDRFRPPGMRHLIGKTTVEVRLRDEVINTLVTGVEGIATNVARDQVKRLQRQIDRLGSGRLDQAMGQSILRGLDVQSLAERERKQGIQEVIAATGRGFRFKLERLGLLNRIMRARMEVAGLLMVVSLVLSAYGAEQEIRRGILWFTLGVAAVITIFSYLTSHIVDRERREDELERLREQFLKAAAEATGRCYAAVMAAVLGKLEELRGEVKARQIELQVARPQRAISSRTEAQAKLTALRSDLSRAMSGPGSLSAVAASVTALIDASSPMRATIESVLRDSPE